MPADQVILGNSTSYGLHLLVQGIPWREGDEVLLVDGDFPATVVPWLPLAERGFGSGCSSRRAGCWRPGSWRRS